MTKHSHQGNSTTTSAGLSFKHLLGASWSFWTLFSLLIACQWYFGARSAGLLFSWWKLAAFHWLGWSVWAGLTLVVLWLGQAVPLTRERWWRSGALHLASGVALTLVHVTAFSGLYLWLNPTQRRLPAWNVLWLSNLREYLPQDLLIYWAVLGVGAALHFYQRHRVAAARAAQLEAQLAQAQLEALRLQLNPHFLFNTLHSIAALVRQAESQAAIQMIAGLSDLLRYTLENAGQQEVTLREELEVSERYLEIQQQRFSDRLQIELQIAPPTLDAQLPSLILQPLLENAIRHGVARRGAGRVEIRAVREAAWLKLEIHNDGAALPATRQSGEADGVGLRNTQARLQQLYGDAHQFALLDETGGGVTARLLIPWRTALSDSQLNGAAQPQIVQTGKSSNGTAGNGNAG